MSENIISRIQHLKAQEGLLKIERQGLEAELAAMIGNDKLEGSKSVKFDGYKITVTNKLTRKLDYEAYQTIEESLPEGVRCVDLKPTLNLKKLRALEAVDPSISAQFITTKPAKAAVTIKEV